MRKYILTLLIIFMLTLTSCSNSPRRTIYESGYFQYKILDIDRNGVKEILIMGLTEEGKQQETLVIPTIIDGYEVTTLGHNNGFQGEQGYINSENLRTIYITNHIKNIGNRHFFNMTDDIKITIFIGNAYEREYRWDFILDYFDNIYLAKKIKEINFPSSENMDNKCNYANVIYDLNYGENNIFLVDDCDGTIVNVLPPDPIREGYEFIGWYKEAECINEWDFENDIVPKKEYNDNGEYILKETILYAKWEGGQFENTSHFETYYVSENEVGISSYLRTNGTNQLTIPSTIDGKTVVEIGTHAFSDNSSIFNITLPNTIKSINNSAFENCTNLTNIDTSNATSLTSIGTNAFLNCSSLTTFTIPTNLNSLGTSVFLGSGVKTINNNSSHFEVSDNTLYTLGKTQLIFSPSIDQLTVPTTVDYIWPNAFSNNEQLTSINLSNVENIGEDAFSGCINLSNINNSSGSLIYADKKTFVDTLWFKNREDVTILGSVLLDYKGLDTSYEIPSSVSYIAMGAFESSTLTEVYIGNNIKTIGEYAFINCQSLDKIYFTEVVYANLYRTSFPMNVEIFFPENIINHYLKDEEYSIYTISTYPIKVNYYINGELYLTSTVNFYGEIPDIGAGLKGYTFDGWLYEDKLYKTGSLLDIFTNEIDLEAK